MNRPQVAYFPSGVLAYFPSGAPTFLHLKRSDTVQVDASDPRVQVLAGLPIPVSFIEFRRPGNGNVIFCPELKMLQIWGRWPDGREFEVSRLSVGEPAVDFSPPADSRIEVSSEPAGPGRSGVVPGQPAP